MSAETIAMIATAVFALIGVVGFLPKVLKYIGALKESVDVLLAAFMAGSDGKITAEEIENIKKEIEEAKNAWKA